MRSQKGACLPVSRLTWPPSPSVIIMLGGRATASSWLSSIKVPKIVKPYILFFSPRKSLMVTPACNAASLLRLTLMNNSLFSLKKRIIGTFQRVHSALLVLISVSCRGRPQALAQAPALSIWANAEFTGERSESGETICWAIRLSSAKG